MLFLRLIYWICGYVVFSAKGGFPERFINLCSVSGIPVRELKLKEGVLSGKTSINGYKAMRHAAKRSGMKLSIIRRRGIPFFLHSRKNRVGVLPGILIFLLIPSILSNFVWIIDVEGNYEYTDEQILSIMENAGLKIGMPCSKVDAPLIERAARIKAPELSWLSVNLKGSSVTVEIREKTPSPQIDDTDTPYNIIAAKEGQTVTVEAYRGTPAVKEKTAVTTGDLLIAGLVENNDTSVRLVHAAGYVTAKTKYKIDSSAESTISRGVFTKSTSRYTLYFLGLNIPLFIKKDDDGYKYYEEVRRLCISGIRLPAGYTEYRYISYDKAKVTLPLSKTKLCATADFFKSQNDSLRYSQILGADISLNTRGETVKVSAEYELLENIGKEVKFNVDQPQSSE